MHPEIYCRVTWFFLLIFFFPTELWLFCRATLGFDARNSSTLQRSPDATLGTSV